MPFILMITFLKEFSLFNFIILNLKEHLQSWKLKTFWNNRVKTIHLINSLTIMYLVFYKTMQILISSLKKKVSL